MLNYISQISVMKKGAFHLLSSQNHVKDKCRCLQVRFCHFVTAEVCVQLRLWPPHVARHTYLQQRQARSDMCHLKHVYVPHQLHIR